MNFRKNNGITGVDISVAILIIVLFVGIIATLAYNFGIESKSVNRKATATDIAVSKIEEIKKMSIDEIDKMDTSDKKVDENGNEQSDGPYTVKTEVTDYKDSDYAKNKYSNTDTVESGVIKIVKVTVSYSVGVKQDSVDISTTVTSEGD